MLPLVSTNHQQYRRKPLTNKIMLISQAERPADSPPKFGVGQDGNQDKKDLIIRGKLASLFGSDSVAGRNTLLTTPGCIHATAAAGHGKNLRTRHTVTPAAELFGVALSLNLAESEKQAMVNDEQNVVGPGIIEWRHKAKPTIADAIMGNNPSYPKRGPETG